MRNSCKIILAKLEGKKPLRRLKDTLNIKVDVKQGIKAWSGFISFMIPAVCGLL
jgi:hypothetical protein